MDGGSQIIQEAVTKTIPKKKKCKKVKWLSEEALQIAVTRREAKSKEEKERYTHVNVEFQRIASRDKKAFLHDQCKEIEENNRIGNRGYKNNRKKSKMSILFTVVYPGPNTVDVQ